MELAEAIYGQPDFCKALQQEGVDLVGDGRALPYQPFAHPMQGRERLLGFIARRHEAHAGPTGRFADRLRVVEVVLVALHEGLHELRGNEFGGMSQCRQLTRDPVGTGAGFHHHRAGGDVRQVTEKLAAREFLRNTIRPPAS